jgi:hypothetical protein
MNEYKGHMVSGRVSSESQVITVCQDIADSMDNGERIDAITHFSIAFDLVHGRLLTKIGNSGDGS